MEYYENGRFVTNSNAYSSIETPDFLSSDFNAAELPNKDADRVHDSNPKSVLLDLDDPAAGTDHWCDVLISSTSRLFFFGDSFAYGSQASLSWPSPLRNANKWVNSLLQNRPQLF